MAGFTFCENLGNIRGVYAHTQAGVWLHEKHVQGVKWAHRSWFCIEICALETSESENHSVGSL